MFFQPSTDDALFAEATERAVARRRPAPPAWTVLLPFFNERDYLPATLRSIAAQDRPLHLILIDNGSTDGSLAVATAECVQLGISFSTVIEQRPGKVNALAAGLAQVSSEYVATFDADTIYPSDYLTQATCLMIEQDCVAAGAYYAPEASGIWQRLITGLHICAAGRLMSHQCHAGGAGQVFETASLRSAGGFDARRWNLVLEDHEIMHRVRQQGRIAYGMDFWCSPSPRERDRDSIRWSLIERLVYHVTPARHQHRFFYDFLAPRLRARKLGSERIRERSFHQLGNAVCATSHPMC